MATRQVFYKNAVTNDRLCAFMAAIRYGSEVGFQNTDGLNTAGIDALIAAISATSQLSVFAVADIGTNAPLGNLTAGQITTLNGKLVGAPTGDSVTRQIQDISTAPNRTSLKPMQMWDSIYPEAAGNYPKLIQILSRRYMWNLLIGGTATSGASTSITDTALNLNIDSMTGKYAAIVDGTGAGQIRKILNNTATVLNIEGTWETTPDNTSVYQIRGYVANEQYAFGGESGVVATSGAAATITKTGAGWTTNQWSNYSIRIVSGTGAGQELPIRSNTATIITVSKNWTVNPDNTSFFQIIDYSYQNVDVLPVTIFGQETFTATGASANSLTVSSLSLQTNRYQGLIVETVAGTGAGQRRYIASNNATTFTTANNFTVTPDTTTQFRIVREDLITPTWPYTLADYFLPLSLDLYLDDPTDNTQVQVVANMLGVQLGQGFVPSLTRQDITELLIYNAKGKIIYDYNN